MRTKDLAAHLEGTHSTSVKKHKNKRSLDANKIRIPQSLTFHIFSPVSSYIKFRPEMAIGYLLISLFSLLFINNFANKIIKLFLNIIRFKIKTQPWEINSVQIKFNSKTTPKPLQVLGYVLLYVGGFFPILIQLALPEYAARGIALSSIVNGISTVILISYYDLKTSIEINKTGNSSIPSQLIWARYAALVLLLTVCSIIYFTIAGV